MNAETVLKEHILKNYKSLRQFAMEIGMPYTSVDNIVKRGIERSSFSTVINICNFLNIEIDDLYNRSEIVDVSKRKDKSISNIEHFATLSIQETQLITIFKSLNAFGRQKVLTNAKDMTKIKEYTITNSQTLENEQTTKTRLVPLYEQKASAGFGNYLFDDLLDRFELTAFNEPTVPHNTNFAVAITGDSMTPKYQNGGIIFIARTNSLSDGDVGLFIVDGEALCKQLIKKDNLVALRSFNQNYKDIVLNENMNVITIGKVLN